MKFSLDKNEMVVITPVVEENKPKKELSGDVLFNAKIVKSTSNSLTTSRTNEGLDPLDHAVLKLEHLPLYKILNICSQNPKDVVNILSQLIIRNSVRALFDELDLSEFLIKTGYKLVYLNIEEKVQCEHNTQMYDTQMHFYGILDCNMSYVVKAYSLDDLFCYIAALNKQKEKLAKEFKEIGNKSVGGTSC